MVKLFTTHDAPDWAHGVFGGTALDYALYASPVTGYPALVSLNTTPTTPVQNRGYLLLSGSVCTANMGNAWTVHNGFLTTDQAADYLEFTPASSTLYVDIVTTGALYPDMQDSRGMDWPASSDGMAGEDATTGPLAVATLRHGTVLAIEVDGSPLLAVDTSLGLQSTRIILDGLSSHTVRVLNSGTVTTPTSDVHRCTIVGIVTTGGGVGTDATWTSPVMDALDPNATWIGADWEQAAPGTVDSLAFSYGQTPTPDSSWQTLVVPIVETVPSQGGSAVFTQEGVPHGRAGFLAPAGTIIRARYAQASVTIPAGLPTPTATGSTVPWLRALDVYASVSETETLTILRLPPTLRGPLTTALQSARAAVLAKLHYDAAELIGSYAIGTARGRWLQLYGKDQDLSMAPGEGQAAYAARLQAALAGKASGPSAQFVASQLSAYIGGTVAVTAYGASGSPWNYTLTVPPVWANPVTHAQIAAFVALLNPAGSIPTISYS